MNASLKEMNEITNFISENIKLISIEEMERLHNRHKFLNSKFYAEMFPPDTISSGKVIEISPVVKQHKEAGRDILMDDQEEINQLLYNLVENFNHKQKEYNELLFDLVFGLMAAPETSDQDERYRIRIMLLYKIMMDLGQILFPNSYINKKSSAN